MNRVQQIAFLAFFFCLALCDSALAGGNTGQYDDPPVYEACTGGDLAWLLVVVFVFALGGALFPGPPKKKGQDQ